MPVFLEDPSQFSKERLKSELIAHNVALPSSERKKQEYLELYLKNVNTKNAADFSSDEDEEQPQPVQVPSEERGDAAEADMRDPSRLTDEDLKGRLQQLGFQAGPITATTRHVYEKKLKRLLEPQPANGAGAGDQALYSDSEDEEEEEKEEEEEEEEQEQPEPITETVTSVQRDTDNRIDRKRAFLSEKMPSNSQKFIHRSTQCARKRVPSFVSPSPPVAVEEEEPVADVLMEIFPEAARTATGITATRRRPIKGAAGRPVKFAYPDIVPTPHTADLPEVQRRQVPLWLQLLVLVLLTCLLYAVYTWLAEDDGQDGPLALLLDSLGQTADATAQEEEALATAAEVVEEAAAASVADVAASVADAAADVGASVADAAVDMGASVADAAVDMGATVGDAAADVTVSVADIAADVAASVADATADMAASVADVTASVADIAADVAASVADATADVTASVADMTSSVADVAADMTMSVADVAADVATSVADATADVTASVVETAADMTASVADTAADVVTSVADGAVDVAASVADAAADAVASVAEVAASVVDSAATSMVDDAVPIVDDAVLPPPPAE